MKKNFAVFLADRAFLKTSFDLWASSSKRLLASVLRTIKTNLITVALSIVLAAILASLWGCGGKATQRVELSNQEVAEEADGRKSLYSAHIDDPHR